MRSRWRSAAINVLDFRAGPLTVALLALPLAMSAKPAVAVAQAAGGIPRPQAVTISGKITDARAVPIAAAVITASGTSVVWTATRLDGSYVMTLAAGSYDIVVRKAGYTSETIAIAAARGTSKVVSLSLADANLSSVDLGSMKRVGAPFNIGVAATTSLSDVAISERPSLSLRDPALELTGVTLAHPADNVPDTSFVVRAERSKRAFNSTDIP